MRTKLLTKSGSCALWFLGFSFFFSQPVAAELVVHLRFDESLADATGAAPDAVFTGAKSASFVDGYRDELGQALVFDGVDDKLELAGDAVAHAPDAYTIAFWIRAEPRADQVIFAEGSELDALDLFRMSAGSEGDHTRLAVRSRSGGGELSVDLLSNRSVFDGAWHHVAWVDDGGAVSLYIDARLDTELAYERSPVRTPANSFIGSSLAGDCCFLDGAVDDFRIYDHAISPKELREVLPSCPIDGDSHCDRLAIEGPGDVIGAAGTYLAIVEQASDDSGDALSYFFQARRVDEAGLGIEIVVGPTDENIAEFELVAGTWIISARVDDDAFCPDEAGNSTCESDPILIDCPAAGDTHCGFVTVEGPTDGGPGVYQIDAEDVFDENGDEVLYTFVIESQEGRSLVRGPQRESFLDIELANGRWSVDVIVDDDPDCEDQAPDAICSAEFFVGCPPVGDTHCDGLAIEAPSEAQTPGAYVITVLSSVDDSGDVVSFTYRATSDAGAIVEFGPIERRTATLTLTAGTWNVEVIADDDPLCSDQADDAICSDEITIEPGPPSLISHWPLDGDFEDIAEGGNPGVFQGVAGAKFEEGFDATENGAWQLLQEGEDNECVILPRGSGVPALTHATFTLAFWVKAEAQPNAIVWSEGVADSTVPLLTIGTTASGATGQVRLALRDSGGRAVLSATSERSAFDGTWHHIAWVDERGRGRLYIDGIRDAADFSYRRPLLAVERSVLGCRPQTESGGGLVGAMDDARLYNYALSNDEILALIPEPEDCPDEADTTCGAIAIEGPDGGGPGSHRISVVGSTDVSGDSLVYIFTAQSARGEFLQVGPRSGQVASMNLGVGEWTIRVHVDDDLACHDSSDDAICTQEFIVEPEDPQELLHLEFESTLVDATGRGNDGDFSGGLIVYTDDRTGEDNAALALNGLENRVDIVASDDFPVFNSEESSIAMWVRGAPQEGKRIWAESSTLESPAVFSLGTESRSISSQLEVRIRDSAGVVERRVSEGAVFDSTWHHIVWIDRRGDAELWIDGRRDPADLSFEKVALTLNRSSIGGLGGSEPCCGFEGAVDDLRVFNYALGEAQIREIAGRGDQPFHRGDINADGDLNISDGVFLLGFLFLGDTAPSCREASDANDDGDLNLTDVVFVLNFLFLGGAPPSEPGPPGEACGLDPIASPDLGCEMYDNCGV